MATRVAPEDLCHLPQKTADAIAQYLIIAGLASQVSAGSGVIPNTNNVGQQAFALATQNTADITTLNAKILQRRVVVTRQNIPEGDALQVFKILPPMPSQDYEIRVMYYGSSTHVVNHFEWRVLNGSQTESEFQLVFENSPANSTVTVIVEELRNVE